MAHRAFLLPIIPLTPTTMPDTSASLLDRLKALDSPEKVADELYMSVLSRRPSADEIAEVTEQLKTAGDRKEVVLKQLGWALLASSEFCLNH